MFSKLTVRATLLRAFLSVSAFSLMVSVSPVYAGDGHNHGHGHDNERESELIKMAMLAKAKEHAHNDDGHDHSEGDHEHNANKEKENQHEEDAHGHGHDEHGHDEHEESVTISERQLALNKIKIETADAQTLEQSRNLFGLVQPVQDKVFRVFANYESLVTNIHVYEGQKVKRGQTVVTLKNKQNLQTYTLRSPANGIVTQRLANVGDHADENPLLEISDYSEVWVELTAFLTDLRHIKNGQRVRVSTLTNDERHKLNRKNTQELGKITYIAQAMTASHMGKARVTLNNKKGVWRPGMHVQANVVSSKPKVKVAVKKTAVQTVEGQFVVFIKEGNTFEPKPVELGRQDDEFIEVLAGLETGAEYASDNSFVLKADLLKSGAEHVH